MKTSLALLLVIVISVLGVSMEAVRIYNSDHELVAELENAFDVGYDLFIDRLWTAKFSLPFDDDKRAHCDLMSYAEIYDGQKRVGLFRIMVEEIQHDKRGKPIRYKCEHVLGTLNSDVMPGIVTKTDLATALTYILNQQSVVSWQLGTNDFSGSYNYTWENRSLLFALFDLPTQQKTDYQFTFDTTTFPWTVNIISPSSTPQANVDYGRNLKYIKRTRDASGMVTRLYAYGFGLPATPEEITIETVNPTGNKYIDSNTGQYGVVAKTWKDQRFTDPVALYNAAVQLLARLDKPKTTYSIDAMDVYQLIGVDELNLGDYIQISDHELGIDDQQRLVRLRKDDITKSPGGDTIMVLAHKERQLSYGDAAYANDLDMITGGAGYKPVVMLVERGYVKNLWTPTDSYPNIYIGTETRGDQNAPRLAITDEQGETVARTVLLKSGYLALKHIIAGGYVRGEVYAHGSLIYDGQRYFGVLDLHGAQTGRVILAGSDIWGSSAQLVGLSPEHPLIMTNVALKRLTTAPTNPHEGMIAYAYGIGWDPGYGEGAYMYYGGAWNFLGLPLTDAEIQQLANIGPTTIHATQWGYVGALTTNPLGSDGPAGRIPRGIRIRVEDGTNANTLECTVWGRWNGDATGPTDNVAKGATTGDFTLNAGGHSLLIEASGLSGNCLYAIGSLSENTSQTALMIRVYATRSDIDIRFYNAATGAIIDMTTLVDVGPMQIEIFYITTA